MSFRAYFPVIATLICALTGCSRSNEGGSTPASSSSSSAPTAANAPAAKNTAAPEAPGSTMSCQMKGMCMEWSGLTLGELKEAHEACKDPGDKFSGAACPTKGLLGRCKHKKDKITMFIYKSEGFSTVKEAKELCDEDGEFTAAPK